MKIETHSRLVAKKMEHEKVESKNVTQNYLRHFMRTILLPHFAVSSMFATYSECFSILTGSYITFECRCWRLLLSWKRILLSCVFNGFWLSLTSFLFDFSKDRHHTRQMGFFLFTFPYPQTFVCDVDIRASVYCRLMLCVWMHTHYTILKIIAIYFEYTRAHVATTVYFAFCRFFLFHPLSPTDFSHTHYQQLPFDLAANTFIYAIYDVASKEKNGISTIKSAQRLRLCERTESRPTNSKSHSDTCRRIQKD